MLLYHPMYDPYHCAYRILTVLESVQSDRIEIERIRIADFFFLFPHLVGTIVLPQGTQKIRSVARKLENNYVGVINSKRAYEQLKHIQLTTLRGLAARGILVPDPLVDGWVQRSSEDLRSDVRQIVENSALNMNDVQKFVVDVLVQLPLAGKGGLKNRSGLSEYRYDVI